jgi:hypothetical protein
LDSSLVGLGLTAVTILSISGTFSAQIAIARRRNALVWFIYGIALGPIAPILVWLSPPATCPVCGTATRGWLGRCAACGTDTRVTRAGGPLAGIGTSRARAATVVAGHPAMLPPIGETPASRRVAAEAAARASFDEAARRAGERRAAAVDERGAEAAAAARAHATQPGTDGRRAAGTPGVVPPLSKPEAAPLGAGSRPSNGPAFTAPPAAVTASVGALPIPSSGDGPRVGDNSRTSLLATGVFTGGTAGLVVGARYAIVRAGPEFQVMGPLDSAPDNIVLRRPLDELDPLCVTDRCIISHRSQPTRALIAMRGIAGLTGEQLEAGLRPTERVAGEAAS